MASQSINEQKHSAGGRLKQLRISAQYSVSEVAAKLHLDPKIIQALEANNYEKLPTALYVKGYIRSYAKLVGADYEELILLYESDATVEPPEITPEVRHPTQTSSRDRPVRAFTYTVSFALVLLLFAWWQSNFVLDRGSSPGLRSDGPDGTPKSNLSYEYPIIEHPSDPFYRARTIEMNALPALSNAGNQLDLTHLRNAAETPEIQGPPGPDRIELRLSSDSWIEIFDANGEKVFVNLARAGETHLLQGTAPFSVILGFAQGVTLSLNGKQFDPAPYSRAGVARFTLGEAP